jgi:hypothetical protein
MKIWKRALVRIALLALVSSTWPEGPFLAAAQQASSPASGRSAATAAEDESHREAKLEELPDSPGATLMRTQDQAASSQPSPQPAAPSTQPSNQPQTDTQTVSPSPAPAAPSAQSPAAAPATTQNQADKGTTQRPVGTAAAEANTVTGVSASQPSGVAIAPAKQRRARTLMIRVGALVGAGVAVGTVVALTAATSSKPPGAH